MSKRPLMSLTRAALCLAVAAVGIVGCGKENATIAPPTTAPLSSFQRIQTDIFAKSCAVSGCHTGQSPTGGLSLDSNAAYANLLNVPAANTAARNQGLVRVKPGDPSASFLFMKLVGLLDADHGARMPLGSAALDSGKLEFIRRWIAAGAADTGVVADASLLEGGATMFIPPPVPTQGFQLHMPAFDIPSGANREIFVSMRSPNTSDVYVKGFDVKMRDNSHHFILYNFVDGTPRYPTLGTIRELGADMDEFFNYRNFFLGSQASEFSYQFPPGVAMRLPANSILDLNSHYVNPTDHSVKGEVYVNVHTTAAPKRIADNLFWSNENIVLAPYQTTTVRTTLPTAQFDVDVYMLTSHMHRRGKNFRIYMKGGPDDGKLIYESSDWHLPVVKTFDPPLRVRKGETLRAETDYYNESDHVVRYGPTSEDEMCTIVGYLSFIY